MIIRGAILAAALALVGGAGGAQAGEGVFLRYLNAPMEGEAIGKPPTLGLNLGGRTVRAVMDTGSTGIVVAAATIPDIGRLTVLGPGTVTYSSSGRIMRGNWVMTPVRIEGGNGAAVRTEPMPVLAITEIACLRNARNCTPEQNPTRVAMIGIGFGREGDHMGQSTPDKNPFLHTVNEAGAAGRGWVVTRQGVQVGLSGSEQGFTTVQLQPRSSARYDWAAAPMCVSIDGRQPAACGTVLMDTGVSVMYLSAPVGQTEGVVIPGPRGGRTLADGTGLAFSLLPGGEDGGLGYGFRVGDPGSAVAPARIVVVGKGDRPPFVNTSVRFLNRYDVLFDADRGVVGYRAR